ncbi:forkhead box protein J2-like [Ceratitis capitata]|uniref:forkhead box protein J2-like n=1 Tax=Ceratitis capitata TaxID=7213 RepID=UPI00032986E2|nr:forkhead box protein J2-like [Ceratitis capitata]
MAINSSPRKALSTSDIIEWISENFPYYRTECVDWHGRVRRNLSSNMAFVGLERPRDLPGLGKIWVLAPKGYRLGDPITIPHVEFVGKAKRYDFPSKNPSDGAAAAHMNPYFEPSHSADASRSLQSSTSSTLIQTSKYDFRDEIKLAINSSPQKVLSTSEIIVWISENFPFYQKDVQDWQNVVRETLSRKFYKVESPVEDKGLKEIWAEFPTLEELYRLQEDMAAQSIVKANEPIVDAALHQPPESMLSQQQQNEP